MNHRYPLSPTIFNVVVDAVLHQWVLVVAEVQWEAGPEGFGRKFQQIIAYFYAHDELIISMRSARLQM